MDAVNATAAHVESEADRWRFMSSHAKRSLCARRPGLRTNALPVKILVEDRT